MLDLALEQESQQQQRQPLVHLCMAMARLQQQLMSLHAAAYLRATCHEPWHTWRRALLGGREARQ